MGRAGKIAITSFLVLWSGVAAMAQQPVTVTYTFSNLPLRIFPASSNVVTTATIVLPRAIKMTSVAARVQILYPNSGDLTVNLFSPQFTRTTLLDHDCSVPSIDTTFSDSAPTLWKDVCPTGSGGQYRPDQPLSNFNNDDSSFGVWQLEVRNTRSDSQTGWLTEFALTISGTTQTTPIINARTVSNTASRTGEGVLAPGELISINGVGLGPSPGMSAPGPALPTELGGTIVEINGARAPIAYTSPFEVQAQVPFDVPPGSTATLRVSFNGQASSPAQLDVMGAVPGLYTIGATSDSPVKAINQDGTINSADHPAAAGSFIVIYASGLGIVDPPVPAGAVPPSDPLSHVVGDVAATVGGVPATVLFAGLAPGIPGVYQINLQIPFGAPSGMQQLLVYSNGSSSQQGATIQIQ